eukprot:TRINITY_DN809_c0_g1_i1.p1 TRINITY_DN809_c0_g1~~TRINITY_DN809_c0_g1_i1.p1  ORF type:complete len:239 (-),score=69.74 TRINITY_DN809_c0_g1_i1:59-775(-)
MEETPSTLDEYNEAANIIRSFINLGQIARSMVVGGLNEIRGENILEGGSSSGGSTNSQGGKKNIKSKSGFGFQTQSNVDIKKDGKVYTVKYTGQDGTNLWIYSDDIPQKGITGMKVRPITCKDWDPYFGLGVLPKSHTGKSSTYMCYDSVPGKFIDVRTGALNGSGESGVVNSGWSRCCTSSSEITVKVNYKTKKIEFLLDGGNSFSRDFPGGETEFVFVFDPYYSNTTFSVEFFTEK